MTKTCDVSSKTNCCGEQDCGTTVSIKVAPCRSCQEDNELLPATRERLGGVIVGDGLDVDPSGLLSVAIQNGGGLALDPESGLYVDFSTMPTDKIEEVLKSLRLPKWLSADTDFYVRSDGNDENDGLENSAGRAFRTVQGALDTITTNYNFGPHRVTLNVAAGSYDKFRIPKFTASTGTLTISGAGEATVIESDALYGVQSTYGSSAIIRNMQIHLNVVSSSNINSAGVQVSNSSTITMHDVVVVVNESTAIASHCIRATSGSTVYVAGGSSLVMNGLSAGSALRGIHVASNAFVTQTGDIYMSGVCTIGCEATQGGNFYKQSSGSPVITGSFTGKCYYATLNATISTRGGAAYFPGTSAGTTETGGQYS